MSTTLPIRPLLFDPSFEQIPEDEAETTRELVETMRKIIETTSEDYGLREAVIEFFTQQGGVWEVRVQLVTDAEREHQHSGQRRKTLLYHRSPDRSRSAARLDRGPRQGGRRQHGVLTLAWPGSTPPHWGCDAFTQAGLRDVIRVQGTF